MCRITQRHTLTATPVQRCSPEESMSPPRMLSLSKHDYHLPEEELNNTDLPLIQLQSTELEVAFWFDEEASRDRWARFSWEGL